MEDFLNSVDGLVFLLDAQRTIVAVFGKWCAVDWFSREELIGRPAEEIWDRQSFGLHVSAMEDALSGTAVSYDWEMGSGKELKHLHCTLVPGLDGNGTVIGALGIALQAVEFGLKVADNKADASRIDVPDIKPAGMLPEEEPTPEGEIEKRVALEVSRCRQKEYMSLQQSNMAAMGEMIGAIAHQWRQPLNSIALIAQDIEDAYDFGELDKEYIKKSVIDMMKQVNFMSDTISDFRNFFRPSKEKTTFDCLAAIKDVLTIISAQFKKHSIHVKLEHKGDGPYVIEGYYNEFKQAMLNLLNNSKDTILGSRLRGQNVSNSGEISIEISFFGGRCCLKISDNGGGIPEEQMVRLFEPCSTTRDKGRGIGLYMVKNIIERNCNGKISVRNTDCGTEFTIEI
ncbi:MAG: PAS domain-containing sensor histidine kinase [Nitrospirae bacterium]|nr:PAS domain-containing sensor histidine kinase [Nitrospirota bacterium]